MTAATSLAPSVFWYVTRGSGYTALVLLSASVVVGVVTSLRWSSRTWPRFASQSVHRSVSLLVVLFLFIHIATSIIDPFAGLSLRDAVAPFGAGYRPVWIALGVIAMELFVAVLLTSLLRHRLPFGLWRAVHVLAYASWPIAVLHSLGTGSDTRSLWAILLAVVCVGTVAVALVWRLSTGWPERAALRLTGMGASAAALIALVAWTAAGPMQAGWAAASGTPTQLLSGGGGGSAGAGAAGRPASLPAGLNDALRGSLAVASDGSETATMVDQQDSSLVVVVVANQDGSGSLSLSRGGTQLCNGPAQVADTVTATCAGVSVVVQDITVDRRIVTATLVTR